MTKGLRYGEHSTPPAAMAACNSWVLPEGGSLHTWERFSWMLDCAFFSPKLISVENRRLFLFHWLKGLEEGGALACLDSLSHSEHLPPSFLSLLSSGE